MCELKQPKCTITFKMNGKELNFDMDLSYDIFEFLGKIAEELVFFTYTSTSCMRAADILYKASDENHKKFLEFFKEDT